MTGGYPRTSHLPKDVQSREKIFSVNSIKGMRDYLQNKSELIFSASIPGIQPVKACIPGKADCFSIFTPGDPPINRRVPHCLPAGMVLIHYIYIGIFRYFFGQKCP